MYSTKPARFLAAIVIALTAALAGSARTSVSQTTPRALSRQALANATYPLDAAPSGLVQLKDGKFDDTENRINVTLIDPRADRDLNGDGAADAVVTLSVNTGGSGEFLYIAVVLNEGGNARPVDSVMLGNRIRMRSIVVARNGEIAVNYFDCRFDQPMAARPTIPVTRHFKLSGDQLIASRPLTNADLNNATYPLQSAQGGQATFANGRFSDAANAVSAQILTRPRASGDLEGDGAPDSAVIVIANVGASGVPSFLCAVLNKGYQAQPTDCVLFGDRVTTTGLAISDGKITLNFLDRKPGEPMATRPSVPTTSVYVLQDGKLIATPGEAQSATYTCADGKTIAATFGQSTVIVEFDGETQVLSQAEAADGFRYANTTWELRGKGDEAMLSDVKTGSMLASNCVAQPQTMAPTAPTPPSTTMITPTGILTGTDWIERTAGGRRCPPSVRSRPARGRF